MMNESHTATIHGVPGERARATGVVRAIWPLFAALFLCGLFLGTALPRVTLGIAGVGFLFAALFLVWALRDGMKGIEGYFKGARGEEAVAALLAALPAEYHVFHDVACGDAGGIDHVAVGPQGVFVIETKCWSGRVTLENGEIRVNGLLPSRSPVAQVLTSVQALSAFLSERLDAAPVCVPIVCFASNTLAAKETRRENTLICNAASLLALIRSHAGHLSPDEIERIVKVMDRKAL